MAAGRTAEPISGALVARRARGGAQLEAQPSGRREGAGGLKAGDAFGLGASPPPRPAPPGRAAACGARQAPPPRGAAGSRGRRRGKLPIRPSGRAAGVGRGPRLGASPAAGRRRAGSAPARGGAGLLGAAGTLEAAVGAVAVPSAVQGLPLAQVTHRRWSSGRNVAAAAPAYCGDGNDKNQVAGRGLNSDPRG